MRGRKCLIAISREARPRSSTRHQQRGAHKHHPLKKTQATATDAESAENSVGSGTPRTQPEGAISGISNLKCKMDNTDQEREFFKVEHSKLEDEVRSVTNSLSKFADEIIAIRQDTTKLSSTLREELAELKKILLIMHDTNTSTSPRHKAHRRTHTSDSASASSNYKKMLGSDTSVTANDKAITSDMLQKTESRDIMCEESENEDSEKERHIKKSRSIFRWSSQDVRRDDLRPPPSRTSRAPAGRTNERERMQHGWGISAPHPSPCDAGHLVWCPEPPSPQLADMVQVCTVQNEPPINTTHPWPNPTTDWVTINKSVGLRWLR
jgi:hypothetical protein